MKNEIVIKLDVLKKSDTLTMEQALAYQAADLKMWERALKPNVYKAICDAVLSSNEEVTNPYAIFRGQSITTAVNQIIKVWSEIQ